MCALAVTLAFVLAHVSAWTALGGGWRGAARAPFYVFLPATALLLIDAIMNDSFGNLPLKVGTMVSWQMMYLFGYAVLRILTRPMPASDLVSPPPGE